MQQLYSTFKKSLIRFANQFGQDVSAHGLVNGLEYVELDAHAQLNELPNKNLIGVSGYTLDIDEQFVSVACGFGVSILDDPQLFQLGQVMDALLDRLLPTRTIPVYHPTTGNKLGQLIVTNGTSVLPVARTDTRTIQFITADFESDLTVRLHGV